MRLCRKEGVEVEGEACQEDQRAALEDPQVVFCRAGVPSLEGECHSASHAEHECGEHQVCRRASVPGSMAQGTEYVRPGPGIVDDAHEGDSQSPQHIQRSVAFFHRIISYCSQMYQEYSRDSSFLPALLLEVTAGLHIFDPMSLNLKPL